MGKQVPIAGLVKHIIGEGPAIIINNSVLVRVDCRPVNIEPVNTERIIIIVGNPMNQVIRRIMIQVIIILQKTVIIPAAGEDIHGKILDRFFYI